MMCKNCKMLDGILPFVQNDWMEKGREVIKIKFMSFCFDLIFSEIVKFLGTCFLSAKFFGKESRR